MKAQMQQPAASFDEKPRVVLIVDDEELNIKFLSAFLSRKGFRIITAETGLEALEVIQSQMPDVILLDAMMPQIDGFEVCRRVRQNPDTYFLPIVMVTALSSVEDEVRALDAGADDFLSKPINNVELMARLKSLLRVKTLHDELVEHKNELESKNKELVELQSLRDTLTQMIIHDLKNPLTGLMGCTELLKMTWPDMPDKQAGIIKRMEESSSTILKMITEMLDVSRMEENKITLKHEIFPVMDVITSNVDELSGQMQRQRITCQISVSGNLPPATADKDILHRVLANLLHNAIKHSVENTSIVVGAWHDAAESRLYMSVKDQGEGIAEEYQAKIFEKFAQAELKKLGLKTDRGLGLTFCKFAVEAHGGKIWVESHVGQGSEFKFYIPQPKV